MTCGKWHGAKQANDNATRSYGVSKMKRFYDQKEVSKLTGISEIQIRYWDRAGLVPHINKQKELLFFDFRGLVAFRTIKELYKKGMTTRKIARCLKKLQNTLPEIDQPLTELRIEIHGKRVIIGKDSLRFTPEGQIIIDLSAEPKAPTPLPVDAEDLFFQALEHEDQGNLEAAQRKYKAVLEHQPDHTDALVNMGNIQHRRGSCSLAKDYYLKALRIDPDHIEANYNLANIFEEQGELQNAILFYQKAIHEDSEFADAYFNLGRVLERVGDLAEAKEKWWTYLNLDPDSEWADYVRSRLY